MLFQIKVAARLPLINELRGRAARVQPSVETRLDLRFPTLQHRRPSGIAADSCPAHSGRRSSCRLQPELDYPIHFLSTLGNHNVIVWSDDRRSRVEKYDRFFWNFHFALAGVITEVETDTDDFAWSGKRRAKPDGSGNLGHRSGFARELSLEPRDSIISEKSSS
jgi:hypothetical protein